MPNHIGAFLKASKCFSSLGINITRVSYNKAVDSHTLFIDAEGTDEQLKKADVELEKIGYLHNNASKRSVVLIEFRLADVPGSVTNILTLINAFNFNISYISSQENGTEYQYFKMGLFIEDFDKIPLKDIPRKPQVGIVGEILVKFLPAANNHLAELLEAEGAEPVVPDLADFLCYSFFNQNFKAENLGFKKSSAWIGNMGIRLIEWIRNVNAKTFSCFKYLMFNKNES